MYEHIIYISNRALNSQCKGRVVPRQRPQTGLASEEQQHHHYRLPASLAIGFFKRNSDVFFPGSLDEEVRKERFKNALGKFGGLDRD